MLIKMNVRVINTELKWSECWQTIIHNSDKINKYNSNNKKIGIKYFNIRSVRNNINDLKIIMNQNENYQILVLTETWIYQQKEQLLVGISFYSLQL